MYKSPLLHIYTYDPESGEIEFNRNQTVEPRQRADTLGIFSSNTWLLRYRGAYIPAAEVAWFHCYQVTPPGRVYLINRQPLSLIHI